MAAARVLYIATLLCVVAVPTIPHKNIETNDKF